MRTKRSALTEPGEQMSSALTEQIASLLMPVHVIVCHS